MLSACVTAHVVCPLAQVHVRYAFQTHDKLYLILDYVPGGPLMSSARSQPPLAEEDARSLLRDMVAGLSYLHLHGIAHQDLKPENILRDAAGRARIADFGVARMMRAREPQDQAERAGRRVQRRRRDGGAPRRRPGPARPRPPAWARGGSPPLLRRGERAGRLQ